MNTWMYAIIAVLAAWLLYKQFAPVKGLRNLNAEAFKEESSVGRIIDVREVGEYRQGYIPGAVNMPLSSLHSRVGEIPNGSKLYLYCRSGMRSKQAGKLLARHGFQVAHLNGGIMAWNGPLKK
ncbi:rhodanese-like domain-containing protein [Paenibacillus sp. J5C_2022]|uniref:rhodanese-like domain-containing protein n=1 Tax=Paenibacillus sp. J5C2022 TaxID=2977129 RepID=UPI0021D350F4|nr:rhodanese-like domain-containing protein [Paenibacillus sp. J5C2022]MCU6713222.1 rhodanese-like domain-containing protein [Paenibacillus sp. J5C2022]